jgi:hypothetical protein
MTVSPKSNFPNEIWNGLTNNPDRTHITNAVNPNFQDWDRIVSEVIAIEDFVFSIDSSNDFYTKVAGVQLDQGELVRINNSGELVYADSNVGRVTGIAVTSGSIGQSVSYIRRGRIAKSDWTSVAGVVELDPGKIYYLSTNGLMSSVPPSSGFVIQVGEAQTVNTLDFEIGISVKL